MENMFLCSVDQQNKAAFCCTCDFPLPCLCKDCAPTHCSTSGKPHNLLPISAKAEIASNRDLVRVQRKLHDLALTSEELKEVLAAFEQARADIGAAYREIEDVLKSTRDKYLAKLNKSAEVYEELFRLAMQQCSESAWRDADFRPAEHLAELLWKHTPGQQPDFGFSFQLILHKELAERLFSVKWLLPFPALSYPEDGFAIKVDLQTNRLNVIVGGNQTIAEVKWLLKSRFPQLLTEGKLFHNGVQLLDNNTLQGLESGAVLCLDQPQYQISSTSTSDEFILLAQGHSRSIESLHIRIQDKAALLTGRNLTEVSYRLLTSCKIPTNALLCVGFHLSRWIQVTVEVRATGHFLRLEASGSETVLALKYKIQEKKGIRHNLQVLIYGEERLRDDRTMESYGIAQECTLQLVLKEDNCLSF